MNEVKNVFIYTRVSTIDQVDGFSLDAQKEEIENYCKIHSYNIINSYIDAGISGKSIKNRLQFQTMLHEVKENVDINAIVVWKLSRFSRNMLDLMEVLDYIKNYDVALISIKDNINTGTKMGEMFCFLAGMFAQMERENIIQQTTLGMGKRASEGLYNGGPAPLGYNYTGGNFIVNEDEAKTIKKIFDLYTNKNWGYSKICKELNSNLTEYATKKGNAWAYATIKGILDNPLYAGYIQWGKKSKNKDMKIILQKGNFEPIITEDLWKETREKRKEKGVTPVKLHNMHYLLSGLLKCPQCGSSMVLHRSSKTDKNGNKTWYRYYCCNQWSNKKAICSPNLVKADLIEKDVVNRLLEFVNKPNLSKLLSNKLQNNDSVADLNIRLKNIDKKITALAKDKRIYLSYLSPSSSKYGMFDDMDISDMVKSAKNQIEELEKQKLEIINKIKNTQEAELNINKIMQMLQNFDKVFTNANPEQQKDLLHSFVKEIRINSSKKSNERTAKEIILNFNELDLIKFLNRSEKSQKFEFTYDTVHPS